MVEMEDMVATAEWAPAVATVATRHHTVLVEGMGATEAPEATAETEAEAETVEAEGHRHRVLEEAK